VPELRIGVLAIQGGFEAHLRMLRALGADTPEVRTPGDLDGLDGLVIPGGESTTISMGLASAELEPGIREHHEAGRAILGTCAGMIVCDDAHLGLIDATVRRNAFGRQLHSFETDLAVDGVGAEPVRAVFIRAPWVERWGAGVEVLAHYGGHPVAIREGGVFACAFHPELTDDPRIHALFMAMTTASRERAGSARVTMRAEERLSNGDGERARKEARS
jgi:pyridoxal 5'-phosphate synthase pdxT subunit